MHELLALNVSCIVTISTSWFSNFHVQYFSQCVVFFRYNVPLSVCSLLLRDHKRPWRQREWRVYRLRTSA
jgi:hypothetical protein